ncbi:MAG: hypothetical protein R6V35_02005 [Candidatus Nanohaloarchaea archaeon]
MKKLYGSIGGTVLLILGALGLTQGLSTVIASSLIITGLGITLMFERRVIKESSTPLEKRVSAMAPAVSELAIIGSIAYFTGFFEASLIYLGLVLLKVESLNNLSEFSEINTSRLMGRISRVLVLGLGVGAAYFTDYFLFYTVVAAGLTAVYDIGVILHESAASI